MSGITPAAPTPLDRRAIAPGLPRHYPAPAEPAERRPAHPRPPWSGKWGRRHDAVAILLAWGLSACLSLFVQPHPGDVRIYEPIYYAFYNVAAGALVGFYLFDRLPKDGFALFALRAAAALLFGTLVNETVVEGVVFGTGPINGVGVYYGMTDALSWTAIFLLLRLAGWLHVQQPLQPATEARKRPERNRTPSGAAGPDCFFVRVADGTLRIDLRDVVCMEAERDFTRVVCTDSEHFVSESLKSLVARSAGFGLVRVHKSFAVNLIRVERLTRTEVRLGDRRVPVGRRYRPAFVENWRAQAAPFSSKGPGSRASTQAR